MSVWKSARDKAIVKAAEALEAFVSKKTPAPRVAKDVELDGPMEFARLLSTLYAAVRGEEFDPFEARVRYYMSTGLKQADAKVMAGGEGE